MKEVNIRCNDEFTFIKGVGKYILEPKDGGLFKKVGCTISVQGCKSKTIISERPVKFKNTNFKI